jgi:hypothetical protein
MKRVISLRRAERAKKTHETPFFPFFLKKKKKCYRTFLICLSPIYLAGERELKAQSELQQRAAMEFSPGIE